jgi:tetratricopeptide (TPR) repeat protein
MADKNVQFEEVTDRGAEVIERAKGFWEKNQKPITYVGGALIILLGGWFAYRYFVAAPNEQKADDAIAKAQQYFAVDSVNKALNGDGSNKGFVKIAKDYNGTPAGNLARYYAGLCYLNLGDYKNAEKYLADFSTGDTYIQARAYSLLGDALAEQKKYIDAVAYYKKAAAVNATDESFNAENLYRAGALYESQLNNPKEAVDAFKKIRDNCPHSQRAGQIDKDLARLGEIN